MSHRSNPKILKVFRTEDWLSRGFYKDKFPKYLEEDHKIRTYLKKKLPKGIVEVVEIERQGSLLKIIIKTARAALIIGRGGEGVEKLRKDLIKVLDLKIDKEEKVNIKIEIIGIKNPWVSASLAAQWMAGQLEKRMPYRRVLKMALSKIMTNKEVKGARVEVAGRLNGIDISRKEWLQNGSMPRQKIRGLLDYGFAEAYCSYGVLGIKVYIYKGENTE